MPPTNTDSYKAGVSDEEEEVVNIVEEMLDGKPFAGGISTKTQDSARQKRACELPVLCPGTIDEFFQEFVGLASRLDASVEFEELDASSLSSFERNGSLSAGQTSVEPSGLHWGSGKAPEVAEGIWSELDRRNILSTLKENWYDGEYSFDRNEMLHSGNDLPWGGLSSFMTVDCGHWY